jgi:protein TonB
MSAPAELWIRHSLSARETGLWIAAAAAVVFAHVAVSMAFQLAAASEPEVDANEAMVVELAQLPFAASQPVESETVTEEPPVERTETEDVTEPVVTETVTEERPEEVQTETMPEEAQPVEPETVREEAIEQVEPDVMTEEIIETVVSEVFIPQPRPDEVVEEAPEEPKKRVEKPVEKRPVKKAEKKPGKAPQALKPAKKADSKKEAKASAQPAVQSKAATARNVNPAKWNTAVRRALARRVGGVRGMRGTVSVQFVVSSSGSIVSASVAGSSGNGKLDTAAVKMVRSARVPAPPPELPGSSHPFTIPLTFK